MESTEELLDIAEAAALLRVSETSLRRWTTTGKLPCVRVGGRRERRFRHADLLAFLQPDDATLRASNRGSSAHEGSLEAPRHLCALHRTDEGCSQRAADFLLQGLRRGDACSLLGTAKYREAVLRLLAERHPALAADQRTGRLFMGDYEVTPAKQLAASERRVHQFLAKGYPHITMVGRHRETPLAKWSFRELLAYEEGFQARIVDPFPVAVLCQVDVRQRSGLDVLEILKRHREAFSQPLERMFD